MFTKVMSVVLGFLGISAFAKDEKGKSILLAAQEEQLKNKYGDVFVEAFKKDLAEYEKEGKPAESAITDEVKAQLEDENKKNAQELADAKKRLADLNAKIKEQEGIIAAKEAAIDKMSKEPAGDGGTKIEGRTGMENKFKPDMTLNMNKYLEAAHFGRPEAASYTGNDTVDTEDLHKEFGRYVRSEKMEIFRSLMGTTSSIQYMTTMITDKFEVRATHSHITSVLQSFTPQWTPKGKAKFTPLSIKQYPMKINIEIIPSDVIDEVLGYLYDEKLDPKDMPIVRYIIEQLVKPKLDEEREIALAQGKYKEPEAGVDGKFKANEANQVCDGYLTQLCKIKKDGNKEGINLIFDGKNFGEGDQLIADVEKAVDEVSPLYKNRKLTIHADPDFILKYSRAYRDKYKSTKNEDGEKVKVDYTKFTFAGLEGMRGTGAFFITPKENFRHLMSRNPNDQKLRMATQDYAAKIYGEWREGVGFWLAEAIFAYLPTDLVNKLASDAVGGVGGI
ncbi:MAG: hypothetical protein HUK10_01325 [Bacteroides heparinolyticus]|nr:hypothetical protein [Bacteroides heparinolyticus]